MAVIDYRLTSEQLDELRAAHREASDSRSAYRTHTNASSRLITSQT
jgi:hypothetical protein